MKQHSMSEGMGQSSENASHHRSPRTRCIATILTKRMVMAMSLFILLCSLHATAQTVSPMGVQPTNPPGAPGPVTGPYLMQGPVTGTYTYTVTAASGSVAGYIWSTTGGTISGSGTTATLTLSNYTGTFTITCYAYNSVGQTETTNPEDVSVLPPVSSGTISPNSQSINYNTVPTALTSTAATGAGGTGTYTYQWQSSPNNSTWTSISGATALTYAPPALTSTTYYHLISSSNGSSATSGTATVTVYPQLVSGTASPASQTVNYNSPASLTATAPTGGNGTYTYQWQSSPDNSTWTNVSLATALSYTSGNLTSRTYYHLISTSNGVSVTSNSATVSTYPQLVSGTISPASQATNYNTTPTALTAAAATGGNGSYTYQWQSSANNSTWTNVSGATALTYAPPALTATTYYHLVSTSNGVSVNSATATITVYQPLVSGTISPASQTINYNAAPASLTVTASTGGDDSHTYQWQSSPNNSTWTNVSGATALTYAPPALTATTYYRVVSTSNGASVNSAAATVTVYPQLVSGTVSPASQTINYNTAPASLTATAATGGSGTYTYQWQSSPNNSTWTNVTGASALTYAPGALSATTYYRMVSTSNGVSVNSAAATVTVYPQLVSGAVSPASQTINYNTTPTAITATAATGGSGTYTYQWQSSPNNSTWTNVSGATALTYTVPALTATTYYHLVSTSNGVSVNSAAATVTVYPQLASGTVSPASQTINYNTTPTAITATAATGGSGTYTYQWQSSPNNSTWTNVSGATALTYTVPALTATTYYHLVSTSNGVSVNSATATITVYPQLASGTISPASQTINYNTTSSSLTATAATGGSGTYTYQWQSSPNNSTWTNVSGATALTYAPGALTATTYYHLVSTSNGVSVTGGAATVTVYPQLVSGTVSPASQTINYNATPAALTATAATGGSGTYTYQWQSSPNNSTWTNVSGATALTYTLPALTATTYYHLVSTSNGGSVTSGVATITVYPRLTVNVTPASQSIPPGTAASALTCTATGGNGSYTYQWQSSSDNTSFTNISGATLNTYNPGTPSATIYYRVSVTSNGVTVLSGSAAAILTDCITLAANPSAGQNYIMTSIPRIPNYVPGGSYTSCDVNQTIQYFDGLGRPLQTVQVKGSPNAAKDIVQPFAYDQYDREAQKFLPYADPGAADGSYKSGALTTGMGVYSYYNPGGNGTSGSQQSNGLVVNPNPYATTGFEPSPLNRVVEQGAPGTPWQVSGTGDASSSDHTVRVVYTTNDQTSTFSTTPGSSNLGSRIVALYTATINADQSRTLVRTNNATYSPGTLFVTITRDENWNPLTDGCVGTREEYKDMEGRVVLKRTYNYNQQNGQVEMLSTYYVYDDLGNLAFVLPPASGADNAIPTAIQRAAYCYQYGYDERNRLTQKTIPGKGMEYFVYNRSDQPVLTQDANQRASNQWTVNKYDAMGRVILTGLWNAGSAIPAATLQSNIYAGVQWDAPDATTNNGTYPTGYVISSYPAISTVLTVNYYDNYNNIPGKSASPYNGPAGYSSMTTGLLTATKTAVLNTPTDMLLGVHYYDDLGRTIETYRQHYLGGVANINNYDAITSTYDFTNAITATTRQHFTSANTTTPAVTIANTYVYDHMGHKRQTLESINGAPNTLLSQSDYNEIGQVMAKHLHSATGGAPFLQDITYAYNERGWLLSSSAPLFEMQLQYNNVSGISGISPAAHYNGNIASQSWGTQAAPNTTSYTYGYDRLNRLTSGISTNNNNETGISYDLNGNILALQRSGNSNDNLTYAYMNGGQSNQIASISDVAGANSKLANGTTTYGSYDSNGNMLSMTNTVNTRTFTYNLLNLPQTVTVPNGTVTYTFDAAGQKLRKVAVINGTTTATDYISGIQYKNNGGTIDFIQTEEGKAANTGSGYDYYYYLGDNLGNTRVTFDAQTTPLAALQTTNYYPFGLEIGGGTQTGPRNLYLYNKKELQEECTEYDYGARFYDPVIGRWNVIDAYAEKYDSWTSYAYVQNNPIKSIDIKGDTIVNASSPGSQEFTATANALTVLKKTNPEAYTTLQNSETNYRISYQADLKSDDGQALNGSTEIYYNHNSWTANATTDAKGNITGGTFSRPLTGKEQDALRDKGVDPKGQTIPISDNDAKSQIKIKGDVTIKLNSSLLSDQKQLTVTLAHEFGHSAFAQLHAAVSKLWSLIGKASALGHDKNNPSGQQAKQEEKQATDNYDNASDK